VCEWGYTWIPRSSGPAAFRVQIVPLFLTISAPCRRSYDAAAPAESVRSSVPAPKAPENVPEASACSRAFASALATEQPSATSSTSSQRQQARAPAEVGDASSVRYSEVGWCPLRPQAVTALVLGRALSSAFFFGRSCISFCTVYTLLGRHWVLCRPTASPSQSHTPRCASQLTVLTAAAAAAMDDLQRQVRKMRAWVGTV
jgi:hypothetical protein